MKSWYVVYTHAGSEAMAQGQLARQNFTTYLPKYRKRRRHARRVSEITVPLFPRYLFVELDLDTQRWRAVSSTYGVSYLVCMGERPAALPEAIIPEIKASEAEDGHITLPHKEMFSKGEVVQIMAGPLTDQVGLFQCIDDNERTIILLNLLGREVPVRVGSDALRAYA